MRLYLKLFVGLAVLTMAALALRSDETYSPSIATLKPNETLVMKYSACHSGCDKGTIKFKNNTAMMGSGSLNLTPEEIKDLDFHFLMADDLESDYFCSMRIMISFKKKRQLAFSVKRKPRLYPCIFHKFDEMITPDGLVMHFNNTPDEVPFWRETSEDPILMIED